MLRFSLRTLALTVTAIGLACAALINASPWIASLAWSATVIGLSLATVAAVLSTSKRRGFWSGFAIVGWVFMVIGISPLLGELQSMLFTTALLQRAANAMPQAQTPAPPTATPYYQPGTTYYVQQAPTIAAAPAVYTAPVDTPTYDQLPTVVSPPVAPTSSVVPYPVTYTPYIVPAASQFRASFIQVGEALWVLVLGIGGGLLGQLIVARNRARAEQSAAG